MIIDLIYILIGMWFLYTLVNFKVDNGYVYAKYPWMHRNGWGSLANPKEVKRGYLWTPISQLKSKFSESAKNIVFLNYFRFDEDFKHKSRMSGFFAKRAENTVLYFDPLSLTQGCLLVGKMGAGKTELYFSILKQKFYNRAIIHQVKAGDFTQSFLTKNNMLFSPYDKRGYLWDVMSENEGIIKTFFENYANAIQGDKKDFFSAAANRLYNEMAIKVRTSYKDEPSSKKWMLLIKSVKDLFNEMDSGTQNSQKDIKGTMEAILEPLEIMAWKMQNPKQKRFVIADFFKKKNQCKLILDNIPEYEKSLTPLFTAFTACCSQVHTSMPDSKTDFTLYALDEYLSFIQIMDDASKKRLHTLIRSKGGILMPAVQYIPMDDKKLTQLLTSSAYAWIYFSVIDEATIKLFKDAVGETEYVYQEKSESRDSKSRDSHSLSNKHERTNLIYNELLNGLGDKFEHIVFLPNHNMLYKGYTPQANLKIRTEKQVPANLDEFYAIKYANHGAKEDVQDLTFADLFKEKPLSKVDEWRLWKKFEKAKGDDKALESFKYQNKLEAVNLEFLFEKYMQKETVLKNKMQLFSKDERFDLHIKWQQAQGDERAEIQFIEKYDLLGALPGFFVFDDIERLEMEQIA